MIVFLTVVAIMAFWLNLLDPGSLALSFALIFAFVNKTFLKIICMSASKKIITSLLLVILIFQFVLPAQVWAVTQSWNFSTSSDYTFNNTKIEFSSGQAQLEATSSPAWYNVNWSKRKPITIDNTGNATTLTNYPVEISLDYDSDMLADFADIRFTDSNGTTSINYWRQTYTSSTSATFWVKVPSISGSSSETIQVYYGNNSATSTSDQSAVFIDYDDFSTRLGDVVFSTGRETSAGFWDKTSNRLYRLGGEDSIQAPQDDVHYIDLSTREESYLSTSSISGGDPVTWTSLVNVTATPSSDDLTKTGGTNGLWDSGAISSATISSATAGYGMSFKAGQTTMQAMTGLSSDNPNASFTGIDYAIYTDASGILSVYENGTSKYTAGSGAYTTSDVLSVSINESGGIEYKKNGTTFYTSLVAPSFPLFIDTSFKSSNAAITDVKIGELSISFTPGNEGLPYLLGFVDQSIAWNQSTRKAYVYGGIEGFNNTTNKILEYDATTNTATSLSETLPVSLAFAAVAYVPSSNVSYIFGGLDSGGTGTSSKKIFKHDITANTVTTLSTELPQVGGAAIMGVAYDSDNGYIYLYGGLTRTPTETIRDNILRFRISDESITTLPETLIAPIDSTAALYVAGNVYIFGGYQGVSNFQSYTPNIYKHDIEAGTLTDSGYDIPKQMDDYTIVWDDDNNTGYGINTFDFDDTNNNTVAQHHIWTINFENEDPSTEHPIVSILESFEDIDATSIESGRLKVTSSASSSLRTAPLVSDNMSIDFEFEWSAGTGTENSLYVRTLADDEVVNVRLNATTSKFSYHNGTSWVDTSLSYSQGQVYNMGYIIDNTAKTFDLVIDGTVYASDIAYRDNVALGDQFKLVVRSVSTSGITYYDNVRVRSYSDPEPSISVGTEAGYYPLDSPAIYPNSAITFTSLSDFSETATKNGGEIKYQISNDGGTTWYWYNSGWATTSAGYAESNTASDINSNISTFTTGSGEFLFKAYLNSNGSQLVSLDNIDISGVPLTPTIGSPTAVSSSSIRWSFTDSADDETGFRVYNNTDTIVASSATANLTYLDEISLSENTEYSGRYAIAYNGSGNSASSSAATSKYTLAATPTNLAASAISTTGITLTVDSFTNDSASSSGYYFSRSGANSGWITTNSWSDTGLSCGTSYTYEVKYRNGDAVETSAISLAQSTSNCAVVSESVEVAENSAFIATYCSSVAYSEWGTCAGDYQYRNIISTIPSNCILTPAQEEVRKKSCSTEQNHPNTDQSTSTGDDEEEQQTVVNEFTKKLNQILDEAVVVFKASLDSLLSNLGLKRDLPKEIDVVAKYISKLVKGDETNSENTAITNFVTYGTPTTRILGEGERAGVLDSYQAAYGKLPTTEIEWQDVIKIANGRWPGETNVVAENWSTGHFEKVYLRQPNMDDPHDAVAVKIIAYGLRPSLRNLNSEKQAIKIFRGIYGYTPKDSSAWDIVRAIAYSGATR